jgi:uncharacterized protein YwgA
MLDDLKKIAAVLKSFGFKGWEPDKDYNSRFFIQKIAYLCKVLGIRLESYDFSIYLHGPYSQTLSTDYSTYAAIVTAPSRDYAFSREERENLRFLKDVILNHPMMQSHSDDFLEAVSTIIFFIKKDNDYSHDSLVEKVKAIKPHLTTRILSIAVNVAKEFLLRIEPPPQELEKELSAWEQMGDGLDTDAKDDAEEG